ncbi:MAG TPA: ABC transporter ATP-binding protein [Phycisphaerae bacterium]|nr:ABC transporter ATP-binding protein [Phycisphaerae bacterium]
MQPEAAIVLDRVWKAFRRGERHDSLRDLVPALIGRWLGHRPRVDDRSFWALREVSFRVHRGEALGIIGPNGAGKSTILKILSKIMRPDRGDARVNGRLSSLIEVGAGFHWDLTGRENIYLNGAILGMSRKETERKFDAIVDFAELADFIDTPIKRYSSGMQARLGFSVAAHMDPEVLLVDEVLSVGDMAFQNKCLRRLEQFQREGTTIVFVSHNLQAVARTCSRVVVLDRGSVICEEEPAEAVHTYLTRGAQATGGGDGVHRGAEVLSVELCKDGRLHTGPVAPGQPLQVRVGCRFTGDFEKVTFGFVVTRASDGLYAYDATAAELGLEPLSVRKGQHVELVFDFAAHLTRGTYQVSIHVRDLTSGTFLDYATNRVCLDVRERATYAGVADLDVRCRLEDAGDVRPATPALATV